MTEDWAKQTPLPTVPCAWCGKQAVLLNHGLCDKCVEEAYTAKQEASGDPYVKVIFVNGWANLWKKSHINYSDLLILADLSGTQTVQYSRGPIENPQGTLLEGQTVKVRHGMVFNIARTDNS